VKFVLVNGRTPYPQTFCMLRCESIESGYGASFCLAFCV
jgi:hypothetical protein